jgi:RNA polymerase sigma factor (sigma-70 family)
MQHWDDLAADQVLAERCAAGDQAAWALLKNTYWERLIIFCQQKLGAGLRGRADAEELAESVFQSLWEQGARRLRAYDSSRSSLFNFLTVLAREELGHRLRSETKRPGRIILAPPDRFERVSTRNEDDEELVRDYLASLPPEERACVRWKYLSGPGHGGPPPDYSARTARRLTESARKRLEG